MDGRKEGRKEGGREGGRREREGRKKKFSGRSPWT
jgi:hypothetical protein